MFLRLLLPLVLFAFCSSNKTELHIGVMLSINTSQKGWSSAGVWPAIELAARHINDRKDLLKNYTLRLQQKDTRCSSSYAIKGLIELLQSQTKTTALIGPGCSISAEPVADAAHFWNLNQISFGAGSSRLSNKQRFPNFYRLISPENDYNLPIVAILKYFNWKTVAVVKQDETIFNEANQDLHKRLQKVGVSVIATSSFVNDPSSSIANLIDKNARIVIALMYENMARKLMCKAYTKGFYGSHIVWLLKGWYTNKWWNVTERELKCTPEQIIRAAGSYLAFMEMIFSNSTGETVSRWSASELETQYLEELKKWQGNKMGEENLYAPYGYDAMWVIARALNRSIPILENVNISLAQFSYTTKNDKYIANVIKEMILNTSFIGMTGHVKFSQFGDRRNKFWIEQMQGNQEIIMGTFDSSWSNDTHYIPINWSSSQSFLWPDGVVPRDSSLTVTELVQINFTLFVVMTTIAGIGVIVTLSLLGLNFSHQLNRFIEQSSPKLNNVFLLGCLACYCCVFLFGAERFLQKTQVDVYSYLCKFRLWILTLGFSMSFGAMFVKTWRVYRIFTNRAMQKTLKYLCDKHLLIMVAILLIIDCAFLTVWQLMSPMKSTIFVFDKELVKEKDTIIRFSSFKCDFQHKVFWIAFLYGSKGLLLVFGLFLAWETRNVKFETLNDSRNIGISVYNIVVWVCITIPLELTVLRVNPDAWFGVVASAVNICTTSTMALVFVPKLRKLRKFLVSTSTKQPTVESSKQTKKIQVQHPKCPHCTCN